jgi:hypothetical protein
MARAPQSKTSKSYKRTRKQVIREGSFVLDIGAAKALYFFTPEGERAWASGWNPEPIYPAQTAVAFNANSVFRLDHDGERSLWTVLEADSREYAAEYICVVEGVRVSRVRVHIQPLGKTRCRVHVRYVHTATSDKGLHFVASLTERSYARKMLEWQRMVSRAIR